MRTAENSFGKKLPEKQADFQIAPFAGQRVQSLQPVLQLYRGVGCELPKEDLGMAGLGNVFASLELLEEFLSRPHTGENDVDVSARLESG